MRLALSNCRFREKVWITEVYIHFNLPSQNLFLSYARIQRGIERLPESRKSLCDHGILLLRPVLKSALGYFTFVSEKDENLTKSSGPQMKITTQQ